MVRLKKCECWSETGKNEKIWKKCILLKEKKFPKQHRWSFDLKVGNFLLIPYQAAVDALVFDNGSFMSKAGVAGDEAPRAVFPFVDFGLFHLLFFF